MTISFYGMNLLPILEGDRVDWSFTDVNGIYTPHAMVKVTQ